MKIRFILFIIVVFNAMNLLAQSSEGRDFWFGFMEHFDEFQNTKVAMITAKHNTTGTLSIPLQDFEVGFEVIANEVTFVQLPAYTEVQGSENITEYGIHITAQKDVSVYIHQYFGARSEATLVLPTESIGQQYYAMAYEGFVQNANFPSEFLLVGVENETTISMTMSADTYGGIPAGETQTIVLNQGETYQVQCATDVTGTLVEGDKPFVMLAGNKWTRVPVTCTFARDNLLEQMYPIETWGKQFLTVPSAFASFDVFRLLAAEDDTEIVVNGTTATNYTLNAGEFVEYNASDATYIEATKGILVAQYNVGSGCSGHTLGDPSMVLLNSIEQTVDTVTLYSSSFENISENYINIIMYTDDVPFITFDGASIESLTTIGTVAANEVFSYARLTVNKGAHTIISDACGIIATAYGYGEVESYAYSGGARFSKINANPIAEGSCLNEPIFFDAGLSPNRFSFQWDLGDGTTSTQDTLTHTYADLGSYLAELIVFDECLQQTDTFTQEVMITLRQPLEVFDDQTLCEGEQLELGAFDLEFANYEWSGPNNFFSEEQFPVVSNITPELSGDYEVVGIVFGCQTFPEYVNVDVIETPQPELGSDSVFCSKKENPLLEVGQYSAYLWQDNSTNATYEVLEEGLYSVTVSDEYGCEGMDSLSMVELCPVAVYFPNIFSPNFDGINDEFGAFGVDIIDFDLKIYDRWGALLFESQLESEKWDGTHRGKEMPVGVYTWYAEVGGYNENGGYFTQLLRGTITLMR